MDAQKTSERFCAADADLKVLSSDNVLFKVHRKNLEFHSDIFADAASVTIPQKDHNEDIIQFSDNSDVLDLLFQHMYRQRQPNLADLKFEVLLGLAEAAEKYVVHAALDCCLPEVRNPDLVASHPWEILKFAMKHGYDELANEAARLTMGMWLTDAHFVLEPDIFKKWIFFSERWHRKSVKLVGSLARGSARHYMPQCQQWLDDPARYYKFPEEVIAYLTNTDPTVVILKEILSGFESKLIPQSPSRDYLPNLPAQWLGVFEISHLGDWFESRR
ncbi:BTB domain-containing protein [Mycena venus]|uniref:BTB domain-containing protein n=1 Tax=Mycena venus TaxID=2733690 RepID=A0A8H6Y5F5_9AGAR|nr:BTB domain-containing protein [Mycena venus]